MDINILELLKPELIILIPVTWGLGLLLKATLLDNKFIPLISAIIITLLAVLWVYASTPMDTSQDYAMAAWVAITQGVVGWLLGWLTYDKGIKKYLEQNNDGKG